MVEVTPVWKDNDASVALKMKSVKILVWIRLLYGAEVWTLKARDEIKIQSVEMWLWRRMIRVSWTEHRTDESILSKLNSNRELLALVRKHKLFWSAPQHGALE